MAKQQKTSQQPSEIQLVRSFEPLLSPKDNKARLTFIAYQHSVLNWKKDGQTVEKPVLKLVFSVLDKTHKNPANIAVTCDYRYNPNNRLGTTLRLMGYEIGETTEVVDEDDEYGVKVGDLDVETLFQFLRDSAGKVYKAALRTATKKDKRTGERYEANGLWEIDFTSIEPFIGKDGNQKSDTNADELGDLMKNPKIDYDTDAD